MFSSDLKEIRIGLTSEAFETIRIRTVGDHVVLRTAFNAKRWVGAGASASKATAIMAHVETLKRDQFQNSHISIDNSRVQL